MNEKERKIKDEIIDNVSIYLALIIGYILGTYFEYKNHMFGTKDMIYAIINITVYIIFYTIFRIWLINKR